MATYYQNPYYDNVFGMIFMKGTQYTTVPSKRIRYKQDTDKQIAEIIEAPSSANFEKRIKEWLSATPHAEWPFKGDLFLVISVDLTKKDFRCKDVDNIAKTIIDSLKGVAYENDIQISSLYVEKRISKHSGFFEGIKCLKGVEYPIVPPMFSNAPWK